ncbi:protein DEHYDRATION-INDUCED 19 homolog 4 [Oryza brachyantha]|uniref:Drought induced 19 protein type zinc-binding domain-containing protein n=1 Tax=Oryza brachyantha TaxID=4533 RepID=J3LC33_ORYBR|nr:protein DEHYDRATION-INDUCED 19 homolog 4 [Oryza brachyantha]
MDSDHWILRLMAAKRQYALQRAQHENHHHAATVSHSHLDRYGYDDIQPEDEVRPDFPCPYCYEDHDITSLCAHLEDEHPFESKVVACPVCSARISKDLLDHITLQHSYLFKLQKHHRLRRVAVPSNHALSLGGRDLQETYLKVLLGNSSRSSGTNASSVTDSLLSSLVLNLSSSETEDTAKFCAPPVVENNWFKRALPSKTWKSSSDSNLSQEERERRRRRAAVRSSFVQHLLVSTLFDD